MNTRYLCRAPSEERTYRVRSLFPQDRPRALKAGWERCSAPKCLIALPEAEMADVDGWPYCHHHVEFAEEMARRTRLADSLSSLWVKPPVATTDAMIESIDAWAFRCLALFAAGIAAVFLAGGLFR